MPKKYKFIPQFQPMYVEVILDEGAREINVQMQVLSIGYTADRMQIYIKDYRLKAKP